MPIGFIVFIYSCLLFGIVCEGEEDTPSFFSLPRSATDYIRILIHGLEVLVISWFFIGPIIVGFNEGHVAALISFALCLLLSFTAAVTRHVDSRFARTAYLIAAVFGLISLPYIFLIT